MLYLGWVPISGEEEPADDTGDTTVEEGDNGAMNGAVAAGSTVVGAIAGALIL